MGNNSLNVLDTILIPQITQGVGESEATVFVDGNHTKISVLTKIVPSPDWFIGLDSLDLCREGEFIDSIAIKVDPYDAGTDNGFTFTSPNWPTEPQGVVFRIESNYPTHPAGSFNYPQLMQLPTLAQFYLTKNKEYELTNGEKDKVIGFISDQKHAVTSKPTRAPTKPTRPTEPKKKSAKDMYEYNVSSSLANKSDKPLEIIDFVPFEETTKMSELYGLLSNEVVVQPFKPPQHKVKKPSRRINLTSAKKGIRGYHASSAPQDFLKKKYKSEYLSKAQDVVFHRNLDKHTEKNVLASILSSYRSNKGKGNRRKRRFRKRKQRKSKVPRSCAVSGWGEWSSCSKSCGIGEAIRTRTIKTHPRHSGTPCPKLREYKWCGSARNCNVGYFKW